MLFQAKNHIPSDLSLVLHFFEVRGLTKRLVHKARKCNVPGRGLPQYNFSPQHKVCCNAWLVSWNSFSSYDRKYIRVGKKILYKSVMYVLFCTGSLLCTVNQLSQLIELVIAGRTTTDAERFGPRTFFSCILISWWIVQSVITAEEGPWNETSCNNFFSFLLGQAQ